MADKKISQLDAAGALDGNELIELVQSGVNVRSTVQDLIDLSSGVIPGDVHYRLSLTTGVPVTTSDVTTASTLYWTPYRGNTAALYTGSGWVAASPGELSLALSSLTSGKNYDVFVDYNNGTPQLVLGTAWTDDTTRAVDLTTQDGVLVLTGNTDHLYVGTIRTISTSATCDYAGGTSSQVGGQRYVWNYYNRLPRPLFVIDGTDSWNYNSTTIRQANGASGNKFEAVIGVAEEPVTVSVCVMGKLANIASGQVGVGIDVTNAYSHKLMNNQYCGHNTSGGNNVMYTMTQGVFVSAGYHAFNWCESSSAGGTVQFFGDAGQPSITQSGIHGVVMG